MDITSLAFGIAALYGVCIECYEAVTIAHDFGTDYGICLLKLDVAKVRMLRWGASVGVERADFHPEKLAMSQLEVDTACRLLSTIIEAFQDTERYSKRHDQSGSSTANISPPSIHGPNARLHLSMRSEAAALSQKTNFTSKLAWAVWRKKKFENMIEEITEATSDLIQLFPQAISVQQEHISRHLGQITALEDLHLLGEVTEAEDPMLNRAVRNELSSGASHYNDMEARGISKMHAGDVFNYGAAVPNKEYTFNRSKTFDKAEGHFGNIYHGNN